MAAAMPKAAAPCVAAALTHNKATSIEPQSTLSIAKKGKKMLVL